MLEYIPGVILENLLITDLTIEGRGVARHNGVVVFLDKGLPGARVSACVVCVKKRVIEAVVTAVLESSPHEAPLWCPHADECGACLWQHFSQPSSLKWKEKHILETFARIGKISNIEILPVQPSPKVREYRNKMTYAFARSANSSLLLGLRRQKERSLVEVTQCGLQSATAMEILAYVRTAAKQLGLNAFAPTSEGGSTGDGYLRFLVIHTPEYRPEGRQQILVECISGPNHNGVTCGPGPGSGEVKTVTNAEALRLLGEGLFERFDLVGFVHSERRQASDLAQGERLIQQIGAAHYEEQFGRLHLTVPHNAFLQTNTGAGALLYELIAREARLDGTQTVWDIYAGIGSIALYLAPKARQVYGVEIQTDAVAAARKNCETGGFAHCTFYQGALTPDLLNILPKPDVIVLDPPRAGLGDSAREALRRTRAERILYVSCDIGTQARDLAALAQCWTPVKSLPVDMFPNTPHVENLVVLEPAAP